MTYDAPTYRNNGSRIDRLLGWEAHDDAVRAQLVEHRYASTRLPVLLANVVVAAAVATALADRKSTALLTGWFCAILLVALLIIAGMNHYASHRIERTPQEWALRFAGGAFLNGTMWGLGGLLFFDPAAPVQNMIMVGIVCGMTAGQVVTSFAVPLSSYTFLVPAVLLTGFMPLTRGSLGDHTLAFLWIPYLTIMVLLTRSAHRGLARSLQLGYENALLAQHLAAEKERAERLSRAKSEFLAVMSHEIRTPMHGMLGIAELLSNTELDRQQKIYLEHLRGAGEYLSQLLNNILDFSKIEAEKLALNASDFSLAELIGEVAGLFSLQASRKGLELEAAFPDNLPPLLQGDPHRLKQVLVNLLGNAFKFTDFGRITLEVNLLAQDAERTRIRFRVIDTGPGISADLIPSLFEPFTQEHPGLTHHYGGTGLGLAISKRLVDAMGGELTLETTIGHGSTFSFTLPLAIASATPVPATVPIEENLPFPPTRVLLADDSALNRLVVREFIARTDCAVDEAEDGAEALEKFRQGAYDMVLMDMRMPVMDGLESVRRIRLWEAEQQRPPVPVIMLTASAFDSDRVAVMAAGCDALLQKPVQKSALIQLMRRHVEANAPFSRPSAAPAR